MPVIAIAALPRRLAAGFSALQRSLSGTELALLAVLIGAALLSAYGVSARSQAAQGDEIRAGLLRTASVMATLIDVEQHQRFRQPSAEYSAPYVAMEARLRRVQALQPEIRYLYTAIQRDDRVYFVLDTELPPKDPREKDNSVRLMQEYDDVANNPDILRALRERIAVASSEPYTDQWGSFISVYVPLFTPTGRFDGVLGADLDVSQYAARLSPVRRAAEVAALTGVPVIALLATLLVLRSSRARRRSEALAEHLRKLVEAEPECVATIDADGRILELNAAGLALVEAEQLDAVRGRYCRELIDADDQPAYTELLARVFAGEHRSLEFGLTGLAGSRRWIDLTAVPMRDDAGEVFAMLGIARDSTARRAAEAQLRAANAELEDRVDERTAELAFERDRAEHANRAKGEFLSNISHELRSPLHSMLGFTRLAREELAEADAAGDAGGSAPVAARTAELLGKVEKSGRNLLVLVNDLLDSAKIEAGSLRIDAAPVDLRTVLAGVLDEFRAEEQARGLRVAFAAPIIALAVGDALRLAQAFRNLYANALRYAPSGSLVQVGLRAQDGGGWRVSVADQGIGIPVGEVEAIFERFAQSSSTKTGAGGTGLGLAIARGIIGLHGGRVWAENRPEGGALFQFTLPPPIS